MDWNEIRARIPQDTGTRWLRLLVRAGKFALLLVILAAAHAFFAPRLEEKLELQLKVAALKRERDLLRDERDKRLRKVDWIRNDADYLEVAARDRLHLQKEGEYIIRLSQPPQ